MKTITIQNLKTSGAKAIPEDQVVYLIVNSKPKAVLLPVDHYEMLMEAMEELEDIRDIEARKDEGYLEMDDVFSKKVMAYRVILKKSIPKDLRRIPIVIQKRIRDRIENLSINPFPDDASKVYGYDHYFRIRVGEYRIIYSVDKKIEILFIVKIGHRKDVYKFY